MLNNQENAAQTESQLTAQVQANLAAQGLNTDLFFADFAEITAIDFQGLQQTLESSELPERDKVLHDVGRMAAFMEKYNCIEG